MSLSPFNSYWPWIDSFTKNESVIIMPSFSRGTMRCLLFLISCFLPLTTSAIERNQAIIHEYMVSPDTEDFDCHSSSVIEVSPGILCAVWKGGPGKGKSNVDIKENVGIWLSLFENGEWGAAQKIVDAPNSVCWTPVLARQPSGELILFYRMGPDPRRAIGFLKRSADQGMTWSAPEVLPAGIFGPTKSNPVFDSEGNMICGSSVEAGGPDDAFKATACFIEIASENVSRWSKYGPIEIPGRRFGCIEPALFWGENGVLKMICRDRSNRIGLEGWIWEAESYDQGKTWTQLKNTTLPNPDSGIDALSIGGGQVLVFYNNSHTCRCPLTVALSSDYGNSWEPLFDIENESGEFPSATVDSNGRVHVTYALTPTGKTQRRIKHVIMNIPNFN